MLKISRIQESFRNWLRLSETLAPLTLAIALLTSVAIPAQARPVLLRSQSSGSYIYGSPIPTPVPVNPVTGHPSRFSRDRYNYYDSHYDHNYRRSRGSSRRRIRNNTLINPGIRIRNNRSRRSDQIYHSPHYPTRRNRHSDFIYRSP